MGRRRTLKKHSSKRRQRLLSLFARRGGKPPVVGVNGYPVEGNVAKLRMGFMDINQEKALQRNPFVGKNPIERQNAMPVLRGTVIRPEDLPDLGSPSSPASRSRRRSRRRSRQRSLRRHRR